MTAPKLIVFDIGNVLVRFDPMAVYRTLLPAPAESHPLWERVDLHAMNVLGDLNGDLAAEVAAAAAAHPEDHDLIVAWIEQWERMFAPEIPGVADILRRVKALGLPVAALSNFAADTYLRGREMYPVLREFDHEFISGRVNLAKPEPAFYALLERETGFAGADIFFVDDRPENILEADRRGWRTHHFTEGADALTAALGSCGLALG